MSYREILNLDIRDVDLLARMAKKHEILKKIEYVNNEIMIRNMFRGKGNRGYTRYKRWFYEQRFALKEIEAEE